MGLLTDPKATLAPEVWNLATGLLKSKVETELLNQITKLMPYDQITEIVILGSITGYKWSNDSDLDVNIRIPQKYITDELQAKRKMTNGKNLLNTNHPVNLFVTPSEFPSNWKESYFGIYDVMNKKWLSDSIDRDKIRDPKDEFSQEIKFATQQLNYFRRLVRLWKHYEKTHRPRLANKYFEDAKDFAQKIDKERKIQYKFGWGIPRKSWKNVLYKIIEHSDVGKDFEYLKEIKV